MIEPNVQDVKFLTVAECAADVRVNPMSVYRLIHKGQIDAIRVGRKFRIYETSWLKYTRRK